MALRMKKYRGTRGIQSAAAPRAPLLRYELRGGGVLERDVRRGGFGPRVEFVQDPVRALLEAHAPDALAREILDEVRVEHDGRGGGSRARAARRHRSRAHRRAGDDEDGEER